LLNNDGLWLALSEQLTGCLHERVASGWQVSTTLLSDFTSALGQCCDEDPGAEGQARGALGHVGRDKGGPLLSLGLQQPFLGAREVETETVQLREATAAAKHLAKTILDELPHDLPSPISQGHPGFGRCSLNCRLQCRLLRWGEGGGGPPLNSKARSSGPCRPDSSTHAPMVWASRSCASATCVADHPGSATRLHATILARVLCGCAALGSRTTLTSNRQRPGIPSISFIAEPLSFGGIASSIP
jgi:hypothetical protein